MSKFRGHEIEKKNGRWFFCDTGQPVDETWEERPCGHCELPNTPEGHDGCLGTLLGVMNACCGHGVTGEAFVQFPDGKRIGGFAAKQLIDANS